MAATLQWKQCVGGSSGAALHCLPPAMAPYLPRLSAAAGSCSLTQYATSEELCWHAAKHSKGGEEPGREVVQETETRGWGKMNKRKKIRKTAEEAN